MSDGHLPDQEPGGSRDLALLEAAVHVFARYGYRKSSMDEVARAAGVSRQCLYLRFETKEDLFRKAVAHKLDTHLRSAEVALADARKDLAQQLISACEEWVGRYVGVLGADDAADLMCASTTLAGETVARYQRLFEQAIERFIVESPLHAACLQAGAQPVELARALHATARGLKQISKSRQEFQRGITVAVELLCRPLSSCLDLSLHTQR